MAVAVQSSSTNTSTDTTPDGNRPTGTTDGDLLLAALFVSQGATISAVPSGWTLIREDTSGTSARTALYWKIASSEPATWTWTISTSANAGVHVLRLDGHDPISPINQHSGQGNTSSTSVTAPAVTPSTNDCLLIGWFHVAANATFTAPASMSEVTDAVGGGSSRALESAQELLSGGSGASTGTRVATASTAGVNVGQLLAIAPPPVLSGVSLLAAFP